MSVIHVSEGADSDIDNIISILESDKGSIDYLGVASDSDPLAFPDLYKMIKQVKPRGLKVMIITDGRDPGNLDDLIGAGYAHTLDLLIGREITDDQRRCISILNDNGLKYAVTVNAWEHDKDSISAIAKECDGCCMFIFRQDKSKPLNRNEMSPLTSAAKACTWNVKTI